MAIESSYRWRVRYRDRNLQWSAWSAEQSFTLLATGVDDAGIPVIRTSKLYENYPNPFNPTTTIEFDVARAGQVRLEVFSFDGTLVKSLIDRELNFGHHCVVWNKTNSAGRHLSSGTYYYRLVTPGYREIRKAVLIK